MSTTIESLELAVQTKAVSAVDELEKLRDTLDQLKTVASSGAGLGSVKRQLTSLNTALDTMSESNISKLNNLALGLKAFNGVGNIKLSSSVASQIGKISEATKSLNGVDFTVLRDFAVSLTPLSMIGKSNLSSIISPLEKLPAVGQNLSSMDYTSMKARLTDLVDAVKPLNDLGKSNLSSVLTPLKKLPETFKALDSVDLDAFDVKIKKLTASLKPLADEMQKVANGFSAFPSKIQKLLNSTEKVPKANDKAAISTNRFARSIFSLATLKMAAGTVAQWINSSNEYVENLNLFTVAMGEYAAQAQRYAETVGDIMGIDPSEWMRNQGVFMTLATGFGVVNDRAYIMSQNLTQLGYDLSSFFNISYEDAMQKLQSGISGELEPLRRLGYDLSAARLQLEAYNLGIQKNVNAMTQAEKAELRYHAIMTQVTSAQGDMARTLDAPANQLRILRAAVVQAARALGNIFIPILNAVLPVAIAVTQVIQALANAIASLFGFALPEIDYSGLSSAAGGVADSADAIDDSLGGAGKKAKELKNALLGIDELNIISPPEDVGGGGGSGIGGGGGGGFDFELPTYDFIGDAVNNKIKAIVDKIKEWLGLTKEIHSWTDLMHTRLGHILSVIGAIGIAAAGIGAVILIEKFLAGLKDTGGLLVTVKNLWGKFTAGMKNLSSISKAILAVTALAAELIVVKSAFQNAIEGNISWGEAALAIIPIAGAVGVAMTVMWGKVGLGLTVVVAVAGAIWGWISAAEQMGIEAYRATEQYQVMAQVISSSEEIIKRSGDALSNVNDKLNGIKSIDADWFTVRSLTNEIFELSEKTNKTDYEMVLLQTKVNTLNSMNIDGLHLSIDETTGAIIEERAAIDKVIEGLELQARQAALQEVLTEAYKAQYQAMYDNQTAVTNLGAAQEVYNEAADRFAELDDTLPPVLKHFNEEYQAAKVAVEDAEEALRLAYEAVDSSKAAYDELGGIIESTTEQYALLAEEATSGADAIGGAVTEGMTEGIKTGSTEVLSATEALGNDVSDRMREVLGIHSPSTVFQQMGVDSAQGYKLGLEAEMPKVVSVFQGAYVTEAGHKFVAQLMTAIRSKSSEFSTVARDLVNGFSSSLTAASGGSSSSVIAWATNVKRWFSDNGYGAINGNTFQIYAKDIVTGFSTSLSGAYPSSKSIVTTWATNVKSWFTDNAYGGVNRNTFQTYAKDIVSGFGSGITSAAPSSKSSMTSWASSVKSWFTEIASYSTFYYIARDVVDGFNNGIYYFYDTTLPYMRRWASEAKAAYKRELDSNSPSMEFWRIARDTVLGYNLGIVDNGDSTQKVVTNWAKSFTGITPTMSFAVDTSALKYYNSDSFAKSISANVTSNSNVSAVGFKEAMEEFYKEYVEPTVTQMAEDMRRQADKKEQTVVQIGNRTVSDVVTRQQNANGYSFVTG